MADFIEELVVTQHNVDTFSFVWHQRDNVDDSEMDFDYCEECTWEQLTEHVQSHNFSMNPIFRHFQKHPCSSYRLIEEY